MCDNTVFKLKQFSKRTPYFQAKDNSNYYFHFCDKNELQPCDGLLCTSNDGKTFKSLGKSLSISNDNILQYRDGGCGSLQGSADITMLCGDVNFNVKEKKECYVNAVFEHPYMCPKLKNSCKGNWQGYDFDFKTFKVDFEDGTRVDYRCIDQLLDTSDCNGSAICINDKIGIGNPFLRKINENGIAIRFENNNLQYEVELRCNSDNTITQETAPLFDGGPTVKRLIWNNGVCPKMQASAPIIGYVILAM